MKQIAAGVARELWVDNYVGEERVMQAADPSGRSVSPAIPA